MGLFHDIDKAADDAGKGVSDAARDTEKGVSETPVGDEINAQARSDSEQAGDRDSGGGANESAADVAADAAEDSLDVVGDDL